jgi:hypothetical protein
MYSDQENLYKIILDEVSRREKEVQVLLLFSYKSDLIERLIKNSTAKLTVVATDFPALQNERIDKWAESPIKFVELASETKTRYDLVLLINPEEYFTDSGEESFEEIHKELIREIQRLLLDTSGILILETHKEGFHLNEYVKPGADKLTKKVLTEEQRQTSTLQAYAFYK